jgi:hypothetical protein
MTVPGQPRRGFFAYIKEAFREHWNLLLFGGATVAALISPVPDVALPLVMAAELTYLTGLAGHPKYRAVVDRRLDQKDSPPAPEPALVAAEAQRAYEDLVASLPAAARARFTALRQRCHDMQRLTLRMQGRTTPQPGDEQAPALNRMLWIFLRLLSSETALTKFLAQTDADAMRRELEGLRARQTEGVSDERLARSITDSIATLELRLENHDKATINAELVTLELNRLESKIQALSEMGISHEDPDFITSQVNSVNQSIRETERAIQNLAVLPGMGATQSFEAPAIMEYE